MRAYKMIFAVAALAVMAGCSVPGPGDAPDGVFDPYEARNRKVHAFNATVDKALLRPAGKGYVSAVPEPVQAGVSNMAATLSIPGSAVNHLLQGRPGDATYNLVRFALNATLGLGGILDPATDFGLPEDSTGFGDTLASWGAKEGGYVVLPVLGPSNERDAVGTVVDLAFNPLGSVLEKPASHIGTVAKVADQIGDRGRYADVIDPILYESADSYAQLRLIYLQNRRHELGEEAPGEEIDPLALDTEGF
ncbi:MAG: VacJ family lipoprotein [Pelagimonas sp.]